MSELWSAFDGVSARALAWVRRGWMTLEEARYLDAHPWLTDEQVEDCMGRRHGRRLTQLVRRRPEIVREVVSLDELDAELMAMPATLQDAHEAFLQGHITLLDVRYAARQGLRGIALANFLASGRSVPPGGNICHEAERHRVLDELAQSSRVPPALIAYYRSVPVDPRCLRLYAAALHTSQTSCPHRS